jgi:redox-sensitive bicupin YhaK (pirin superfamily)
MNLPLQILPGHAKDLGGGFTVRRFLPSAPRQAVGPFLFMDHFGPVTVTPGAGHDVRPHPHIGLATVTYLFDGAIHHRDSLGFSQRIEPGAINWMTAGKGIVHSERQPEDLRSAAYVNHGLQLWAALPEDREEAEPSFAHTPAAAIPEVEVGGVVVRVLVGSAFGATSPVAVFSPTVYLDVQLPAGGSLDLPALAQELAIYPVNGPVQVGGVAVAQHTLAVLPESSGAVLTADAPVRLAVLGGAPLGRRLIWWNFVASRRERIVHAAAEWEAQRMGQVPGETEFIPAPELRV